MSQSAFNLQRHFEWTAEVDLHNPMKFCRLQPMLLGHRRKNSRSAGVAPTSSDLESEAHRYEYQDRNENQLNDVVLLRQFILLRAEPCQPLNHHWEQREDSNRHMPKHVLKKPKLVARRLNSISASSLASDVLRGTFLNDIEDIKTPCLEMVPTERVALTWPLWTNDLQSFLALYETK